LSPPSSLPIIRALAGTVMMLFYGMAAAADPSNPPRATAGTLKFVEELPHHDEAQARSIGVVAYTSKRLKLFTDIDPKIARTLPPLVDEAYDAWVNYFGRIPAQTEFQINGYLMKDPELFRKAGMIRGDLPYIVHGRHRGAEFWMFEQDLPYYREHLLLHEATHCFMTILPQEKPLPLWYFEGMAELFGVHPKGKDGKPRFAVMPGPDDDMPGFARISVIHRERTAGRSLSLAAVQKLGPREFGPQTSEPYAWSWALCEFLSHHPRYRERFQQLGESIFRTSVGPEFQRLFADDAVPMGIEWAQFARHIVPGYDFERTAIEFETGKPLGSSGATLPIRADRGWQSSKIAVEAGATYAIAATGRVTLGKSTKPWLSGPEGITLRYADGRPIGKLLAGILADKPAVESGKGILLEEIEIGPAATFQAAETGTLYFRVNDAANSLSDNDGAFEVRITRQ
jgi:hypothetical protein